MAADGIQRAAVRIKGLKPLLMSAPTELFDAKKSSARRSSKDYDDKEEAEKRAYRDKEGYLMIPARCVLACIIGASKLYRTKGSKGISFSNMLKGSIDIAPEQIRLLNSKGKPIKDYKIDRSLVVVQRARIIRCRPVVEDWHLEFEVVWNPKIYGLNAEQLEQVMKDAGFIGLLDWRPRFGIFELESFKTITK